MLHFLSLKLSRPTPVKFYRAIIPTRWVGIFYLAIWGLWDAYNITHKYKKNYPKISALLRYIPSDVIHPGTLYKDFLLSAYKLLPKEEFAAMADALDGKGV